MIEISSLSPGDNRTKHTSLINYLDSQKSFFLSNLKKEEEEEDFKDGFHFKKASNHSSY